MRRTGFVPISAAAGLLWLPALAEVPPPAPGYPDPARLEPEVVAFEEAARDSAPPVGAVVCVGSSSMRMWQDRMADDLSPLTVVPRGFGGSTMYDALVYLPRLALGLEPRAMLLYEGDNDIDFGVSPEGVAETFAILVEDTEAALPGTRIYVVSIKPSPARWAVWPAMEEANRLLAHACEEDSLLTYIDVATPMLGADGRPLSHIFLPDSLHMNGDGYAIWTEAIRPVLVEQEGRWETTGR
jgi:lysophospholipase L1-like esterase